MGIDTDGKPKVPMPGDNVILTYSATSNPSDSVKSSWEEKYGNPKTNFWTYQSAYGLSLLYGHAIQNIQTMMFQRSLHKDIWN